MPQHAPSLDTLFCEAIGIDNANSRADFIQQRCGTNGDLRLQLEKLVAAHFRAGNFLEQPVTAPAAELQALTLNLDETFTTAQFVGISIGPYKIRELLGEGGMGSVYVAEQEKPVRRKVALKLIKPGMDSREVVARFEAERQALTMMDHPNIAKVLDAGTTDRGRPYFAMELVRGLPITEHCDAHKFPTRDRLESFLQVCRAIQHAHQKAVIHRDLKPSNILVAIHDTMPVAKVIDFGVAKALGTKLTDQTLYTGFNQLVGTPLYMSPEQAGQCSLDIDTRSDIYSLGVLLYELLTGRTPFDSSTFKAAGYDEMRRIVREVDPPRPSARVSTMNAADLSTIAERRQVDPSHLSRMMRGELDWIVMKALEKDRNRRYQSVSGLAADVQRYLDNEPVEACPPSVAYRLRKFSRRYRAPLATALALVLMMLSATALSIRWAMKADRALQSESNALANVVEKQALLEKEKADSESRRLKAEKLESEAVLQRDLARRNLYLSDMRLAAIDLGKGNPHRLYKKLNEHIPKLNAIDFRCWEWFYLQASSRQEQRTFFGNLAEIEDVDWSPDGKYVASSGHDGLHIWDALTGLQVYENRSSGTLTRGVAWSPDCHQVAWGSAADDNAIRIWDSRSNEVAKLVGHTFSISDVCWGSDARQIASSSGDGSCRVWDVEKQQCLFVLKAGQAELPDTDGNTKVKFGDISWNSKQDLLAAANNAAENCVVVWNPRTGEKVATVATGRPVAVEFSLDGHRLIVGTEAGSCVILDTQNWTKLHEFQAHQGSTNSISVSPNQTTFATGGSDRVIHIWDLADGHLLSTLYGHTAAVNSVAWNDTGELLVSGGRDAKTKVWNIADISTYQKYAIDFCKPSTLSWESSGSQLLFTSSTGTTGLVDPHSRRIEHLGDRPWWSSQGKSPTKFDFVDNHVLADNDDIVKPTQLDLYRTDATGLIEYGFSWAPNGKRIALFRSVVSPIYPGSLVPERLDQIEIWTPPASESTFQWTINGIHSAQWSPDSRRLAVAGSGQKEDGGYLMWAGWIYIFDLETGKMVHKMKHGTERCSATAIAWKPTGTEVISGNDGGLVCIWHAGTGDLLRSEVLHGSPVLSLAWSADNQRIASASANGQVKIVDVETCQELITLQEEGSPVSQLTWSPDGRRLAGIDSDGVIVLWDATRGYEMIKSSEYLLSTQYEQIDLARQLARSKKYDAAMLLLDELESQRFGDSEAINEIRGAIYLGRNELESALEAYTHVIELSPTRTNVWMQKIEAELQLGRLDDAINSSIKVIESGIESKFLLADCYRIRGIAYRKMGKRELQLAEYQKAIEIRPMPDVGLYNDMAWGLVNSSERTDSDVERAVRYARQAVDMDSGEFAFARWNTLGVSLYYAGAWQEATDALQKSMKLESAETSFNLFPLAMACWQLDQNQAARQYFDQALKWMHDNQSQDEDLLRFHAEARELLGIE